MDTDAAPPIDGPGTAWFRQVLSVDAVALRWLGGGMLALGAVLPHLPHDPGLPCPLRTVTGVPCPLCGMTTAVKALCTGHPGASIGANPFGILLVIVCAVVLLRPSVRTLRIPVTAALAIATCSWLWELRRFGVL